MLHTGLHDDYHRPSDDADKINAEGLKQIAQLMFNVLVELADAPSSERLSSASRDSESRVDQQAARARPAARRRADWAFAGTKRRPPSGQIVVTSVNARLGRRQGGPARRRSGAEVRRRRDVTMRPSFCVNVLAATSPVTATVERPGEDEPLELTLELARRAGAAGNFVAHRRRRAASCVIVNRVTPGSPADLAGLRVNDRIYRIGGREFADGEEFRQLVADAGGPLALEVEGERARAHGRSRARLRFEPDFAGPGRRRTAGRSLRVDTDRSRRLLQRARFFGVDLTGSGLPISSSSSSKTNVVFGPIAGAEPCSP